MHDQGDSKPNNFTKIYESLGTKCLVKPCPDIEMMNWFHNQLNISKTA